MPGEGYKLCPYCFEEIKEGALKCKHCRTMLIKEEMGDILKNSEERLREVAQKSWNALSDKRNEKYVWGGLAVLAATIIIPVVTKLILKSVDKDT